MPNKQTKLVVACIIGNILEWFDFAVYGCLATIIAHHFFPSHNILASMLLTYSVFGIGFLVRPIGAMVFGHIGDTQGRKTALLLSSILMALPTFCIGLIPNYEAIGILAPLLLLTCRILQGFSLGGEFAGSLVYLVEQADVKKRGFVSCWADIGGTLGMLLGSLSVVLCSFLLGQEAFEKNGWRLLFLSGIFLSFISLYIRSHLEESREFMVQKQKIYPLKKLLGSPMQLLLAILILCLNSFGYYTLLVFFPNQHILLGTISESSVFLLNSFLLICVLIGIMSSAKLSNSFCPYRIYQGGAALCLLLSYPLFFALQHFNLVFQGIIMSLFALGLGCCIGPRTLVIVQSFPVLIRYSGVALAYNTANALFGGTAPFLTTYIFNRFDRIGAPALFVLCSALVTLLSLEILRRKNTVPLS